MTKDTDSLNLKYGPPFNAVKGRPFNSKLTVIAVPAGPGPASPYRDTMHDARVLEQGNVERGCLFGLRVKP
nr:hypothetical protein [uncultured Paludibaculum sp.]